MQHADSLSDFPSDAARPTGTDGRRVACLVLAAGKGTRMKSALPKVLHEIGGRAMLHHVLDTCAALDPVRVVTVVGTDAETVAAVARAHSHSVAIAVQDPPLGTAHAVTAARDAVPEGIDDALVLFGDTPLIRPETLQALIAARREGAAVAVLGFTPEDPAAYGRLITDETGRLEAIVEAREATPEQLAVRLCNGGVMAIDGRLLYALVDEIDNANAKGEFYLTDIVAKARARDLPCAVVEADETDVLGVNARSELAFAESLFQARRRAEMMAGGVTLRDPETVYFSWDTQIAADVVVGQNVVFGPGVSVESGVEIRPFCHLDGAHVGAGSTVGPFARLRPGARIGDGGHIGNFVEIKKADLAPGVKVNHLSYIGDASVGSGTNVGAGAITCNYDGYNKHRTVIGENVFVGTNCALVAPITIGDGAFLGAGSTITKPVAPDALAVTRPDQREVADWARRYRERMAAAKAAQDRGKGHE